MKFMLDTNVFDFIYDNDLIDLVNSFVSKDRITFYVTHVQNDELKKIKDPVKKEQIEKIQCIIIQTSGTIVGTKTNRGFEGSRIGFATLDGIIEASKNEELSEMDTHPLGKSADKLIVNTAIKENMDYLVSNDNDIIGIVEKSESKVKVINCNDFKSLLDNMHCLEKQKEFRI